MSEQGILRARLTEVAALVGQDEELARRLHELARSAAASGSREDFEALYAAFARTPDEMARLVPDLRVEGEDGHTTTTITTTTTVTTLACTGTTITTTTTTTYVEDPGVEIR